MLARSFTWVAAFAGSELVGFVHVAWDGGVHFFLLDTTVHPHRQHRGIGGRLVAEAIGDCRGSGEWVHVDSSGELKEFYRRRGFGDSHADILRLDG